jgi:hypothetical protein
MKKTFGILLLAFSLLTFANESFAQMKFGARAGVNISTLRLNALGIVSVNSQSKIGLNVGAFAEVELSDKLVLQPELAYSSLGGKVSDFDIFEGGGTTLTNLDYIVLPLLLKYKASNFSIGVGPQLGFLISAKEKVGTVSENTKEFYKSTELSGLFNADYTIGENFVIGARYQLGLSNILVTEGDFLGVSGKNGGFQILLGYKF